ncbi:MAG: hypothetical protein MJZ32_10960 [Bacteroidaceae bacterium]|nr:hypothetical protein [Bacteroidaceae bacterium]
MKKFYSIIAFVAMFCTSMCLFTSCGSDDDEPQRVEKQIVSVIFDDIDEEFKLSAEANAAAGKAMHAAQDALQSMPFKDADTALKLMKEYIKNEFEKLDNVVKYELKTKKIKIKMWCSNVKPNVEYTFDCSELQATAPQVTATIDAVTVSPLLDDETYFSKESAATIKKAIEYLSKNGVGKSVNTEAEKSEQDVAGLAVRIISEEFDLAKLPETADGSKAYQKIATIDYTSSYSGKRSAILTLYSFRNSR